MNDYERLLRERIEQRVHDLYDLDHMNGRESFMVDTKVALWKGWRVMLDTQDMSIETLEQMVVELACQMFAFSSRRAPHLPILAAFHDRAECESEERRVLARIREGCTE